MIFLIASILFQVVMIAHVIRSGRNQLWIMAIAFVPLAGGLAYFLVEVLPGMRHNRHVRGARAAAERAIDPERELRAARDALAIADTLANRLRLADALGALGRWAEAVPVYEEAAARGIAGDSSIDTKLAEALQAAGRPADALAVLDRVPTPASQSMIDRQAFLRAKALEDVGRGQEAAPLYADIVTRLPGDEARCRYAALLLALGRRREARELLDEVAARAARMSRTQRRAEAEMYDWAERTRAELHA